MCVHHVTVFSLAIVNYELFTFRICSANSCLSPWYLVWLGPLNIRDASTRSSLREDKQRAKTASPANQNKPTKWRTRTTRHVTACNNKTVPHAHTTSIYHASPPQPRSEHPKDCTRPHFASYPSETHHTSISPSYALLSPGSANSQSSLPMSQSHMSTHSRHRP